MPNSFSLCGSPSMVQVALKIFGVGGIPPQCPVIGLEVGDFVPGQRKTQLAVRPNQGVQPVSLKRNRRHRRRFVRIKQGFGLITAVDYRLRHAVKQMAAQYSKAGAIRFGLELQPITDTAFDAMNRIQSAGVGDIRRLAGPRGDRSWPRNSDESISARRQFQHRIIGKQQSVETLFLVRIQRPARTHKISIPGVNRGKIRVGMAEPGPEFLEAEFR
jgi:hypothetical protein